jgi:hypothetical protein
MSGVRVEIARLFRVGFAGGPRYVMCYGGIVCGTFIAGRVSRCTGP